MDSIKKVFWFIFGLGLLARLISFVILPESAYTDSVYHIMLARDIVLHQTILLSNWILPPPLFHSLLSSVSILAGLAIDFPFLRAVPVTLSIALLLSCFLLFRRLFGENYIVPLSFVAIFPWLVRYGTVSYTENFSLMLLVFSVYLALRFIDSHRKEWLFALAFSIPALALTKLNATFVAPILFALVFASALMKNRSLKLVISFAAIVVFLSFFWFFFTHAKFGYWFDIYANSPPGSDAASSMRGSLTPYSAFLSHLSFYDFPPAGWFSRLYSNSPAWLLSSWQLIFFAITVPITVALLFGFWLSMRIARKRKFYACLGLIALALLAIAAINRVNGVLYIRYLIPTIPILAIFFSYCVIWSKGTSRKILVLAFAAFAVYSFAYCSISAGAYSQNFRNSSGMFTFISSLQGSPKIFSEESGRAIGLYTKKEFGWDQGIYSMPAGEAILKIKSAGFTHIAVSCYRRAFPQGLLDSLESRGFIARIYNDSCSSVYAVKQ